VYRDHSNESNLKIAEAVVLHSMSVVRAIHLLFICSNTFRVSITIVTLPVSEYAVS